MFPKVPCPDFSPKEVAPVGPVSLGQSWVRTALWTGLQSTSVELGNKRRGLSQGENWGITFYKWNLEHYSMPHFSFSCQNILESLWLGWTRFENLCHFKEEKGVPREGSVSLKVTQHSTLHPQTRVSWKKMSGVSGCLLLPCPDPHHHQVQLKGLVSCRLACLTKLMFYISPPVCKLFKN